MMKEVPGLRKSPARRLAAAVAAFLFLLTSGAARADERPLARVVLMPELIPSVVTQLVPMTIELPAGELRPGRTAAQASRIEIEGLVYCAGDGKGGAWAIGAAYPAGAAAEPNMLAAPDCQASLPAIAQRLTRAAGAPQWVEVIKAHVSWTPWMLRFAAADAASAGNNANAAPRLSALKQLKSFPTSNLHILPPPGEQSRFDVAIGFSDSSIVAALFAAGRTSNPVPYLEGDPVLEIEMADAPARANTVADAQYAFINALLRMYAPSFEIPLQLQGMTQQGITQRLTARNLRAEGDDNTMTLTGQLEFGNVSYSAAVHCEGDDLAIRQVTLVPPPIKCDNADPIAQLQCQGQQAAGGAFGPMLTSIYQGQRFHYSTVNRPLRFTLGDAQFAARFEALRSSSRGSSFNEDGNVMVERIDRAPAPLR